MSGEDARSPPTLAKNKIKAWVNRRDLKLLADTGRRFLRAERKTSQGFAKCLRRIAQSIIRGRQCSITTSSTLIPFHRCAEKCIASEASCPTGGILDIQTPHSPFLEST